jgi:paraquat-inducible protein B
MHCDEVVTLSDDITPSPAIVHASVRRSRRISPMWLIPLFAVAIGGWLAWDTYSKKGPTITITFESAEGLQTGQSQLKFKEIVLGTVKSLDLTQDQTHVSAVVETTRQAVPLLTDNTIFWVVKPRLFAGNLEGLSTLTSGSYIGMLPARTGGKPQRDFVGHEDPPVLQANVPGRTVQLTANKLGSISVGSPIFFHDLDVGTVLGWDIGDMVESVTIHAFVRAPYDSYVHDDTRFWNASGFSVNLGATGVDVQIESLRAVLLGGLAFDTPATAAGTPTSAENHVFPLFATQEAAKAASYSRTIPVMAYFKGSVDGLGPGSPVRVHGLTIGHVTSVALSYDPATGSVVAPVEFTVQPERILGVGNHVFETAADAVNTMVNQGWRATLQSASLITGQQVVALDVVPDVPRVAVTMVGKNFVIPTSEGGGIAGLETSATDVLSKVNTIPFDQIGKNLNGILLAANNAAGDDKMKRSLADLADIIISAKGLVANLDNGLSPAVKQVPELVTSLQKTLANLNVLVQSVGNGYGDNTKFNRDLGRLLVQANDTLTSVRSLADLLSRDPAALIKGRGEGIGK